MITPINNTKIYNYRPYFTGISEINKTNSFENVAEKLFDGYISQLDEKDYVDDFEKKNVKQKE